MENWRPIDGYPGYEVSDQGRVRSVDRMIDNGRGSFLLRGKVFTPFITKKGYHSVGLRRDGKYRRFMIHRLVCANFLGLPDNLQVRHLDGDPANNAVHNLAPGTNSENQHDSVLHGTHHCAQKQECKRGHPFDAANTLNYRSAKGTPARACRTCRRDAERARRKHRQSVS